MTYDTLLPTKTYCPTCKGQAKVIGLGMMLKLCLTCNATGYVELKIIPKAEKPELPNINGEKKRRRKNNGLPIVKPEPILKPFTTESNSLINGNSDLNR